MICVMTSPSPANLTRTSIFEAVACEEALPQCWDWRPKFNTNNGHRLTKSHIANTPRYGTSNEKTHRVNELIPRYFSFEPTHSPQDELCGLLHSMKPRHIIVNIWCSDHWINNSQISSGFLTTKQTCFKTKHRPHAHPCTSNNNALSKHLFIQRPFQFTLKYNSVLLLHTPWIFVKSESLSLKSTIAFFLFIYFVAWAIFKSWRRVLHEPLTK